MKIITWNVNGFRSLMNRSFLDTFNALDADVYCLQETKLQEGQGGIDVPGFHQYWNYAERKGYSGTAVLTLREPAGAYCGIGSEAFDAEGRVITADYGSFYLVNCYAPNVGLDLSRLEERTAWDAALLAFLKALDCEKPVILCGDLNAAYNDADLNGKAQGMQVAGYTQTERSGLTAILSSGFVDAYRHFHPNEKAGAFAYRRGIRAVGMDYFLVSERLMERIADVRVHNRVRGSDHWPMELILRE
ncbi:MAG: exodeoxyribonuclease III [Clostridia bacterium]|nr:exodeoxyribonuclease III [Clostridia bacterium]